MYVIADVKRTWRQLCNAACFSAYPYLSVSYKETVNEVGAKGCLLTVAVPVFHVSLFGDYVHAAQCTDKQVAFGRHSEIGYVLMLQRIRRGLGVVLVTFTAEKTVVGSKPYRTVVGDYSSGKASSKWTKHLRQVINSQTITLVYKKLTHSSGGAHYYASTGKNITNAYVRSVCGEADGLYGINQSVFVYGDAISTRRRYEPYVAFCVTIGSYDPYVLDYLL